MVICVYLNITTLRYWGSVFQVARDDVFSHFPRSYLEPQNPQNHRVDNWVVVSNIFYFWPYLGKWSNLTNIFQGGWNHQLDKVMLAIQDMIQKWWTSKIVKTPWEAQPPPFGSGTGRFRKGGFQMLNIRCVEFSPQRTWRRFEKRSIIFFWVVVSNIFYFHPYLGKISNLTHIFQMGWKHQLVLDLWIYTPEV